MKRTYWYLAVTGLSGALFTVAIADNASKSPKSERSTSVKNQSFFASNSGHEGVSGSAADTGDDVDPLRIDPTSSSTLKDADVEFEGLLKNTDSAILRAVPEEEGDPSLFEAPAQLDDDYASPQSVNHAAGEIVPTGGLFGRRSRYSSSNQSSTTAKSDDAGQQKTIGIEGTEEEDAETDLTIDPNDLNDPSRRISDREEDEGDSLSPFDPIDESFADGVPRAPEDRDPNFRLDDEQDLIEIELGNKQRSRTNSSNNDDLQGLFDPREETPSNRVSDSAGSKRQPAPVRQQNRNIKPSTQTRTLEPVENLNQPSNSQLPSKTVRTVPVSSSTHTVTSAPTTSSVVTPSISLTWVKHGTVNIGQPSSAELIVQNTGNTSVENVNVEVYVPLTVRMTKAEPPAREEVDHLTWVIPTLETQKEYKIQIELIPNERGELPLSAQVRFSGVAKASLTVEEPMLKLAVKGPSEVALGDPASQVVVVSNPGTGVAQNIVLECTLSEGLTHKKGREFKLEVGSLDGGESRQFRLPVEATQGGKQFVKVVAQANGGLTDSSESTIDVSAPSLEAVVKGPGFRYLQRTAHYTVTISNSGQAESNNIRVIYAIPRGFRFVTAGQGGEFHSKENSVLWFVGQLGSDQSRELTLDLKAVEAGQFTHDVSVVSDGGTTLATSTKTEVDGAVDLVLEVSEDEDPVEIGTDAVYEIKVRNDGTKAASNLVLSCTIPNGLDFQSASGPSKHTSSLGDVSFDSISTLKPGESVIYRVVVQGKTAGQHRLRAQLNSDSLNEPIVDEELTRFYGE
ncbi:MAG: hypothetical protein O2955_02735 [Planctomycetota bacterium]|nr:hypothetical protein [Planctomycetota bacterium]MDA1211402.1 hypothetical protein [Planctomycetota bacterium]